MTIPERDALLDPEDPAPANVLNPEGRSPFLFIGDHAGNAIPRRLGLLGLSAKDRARHIALDIGVRKLGERLASALDACFVHQHFSRLVIDCNRDPDSAAAIPEISDGTPIPGNLSLYRQEKRARVISIHEPYQARIGKTIAERGRRGRRTILVSLHSFTPVLAGQRRPWEIGILYSDGDTRLAVALLAELRAWGGDVVGDNEPYRMDATDHTVPRHAFPTGLPYAEVEVRQDLLGNDREVAAIATVLTRALSAVSRP